VSHGDGNVTATRVHSLGRTLRKAKPAELLAYRRKDFLAALARRPSSPPEELWQAEKWFLELSAAGANDEGGQHSRNFFPTRFAGG
jgi:hypothetical protein